MERTLPRPARRREARARRLSGRAWASPLHLRTLSSVPIERRELLHIGGLALAGHEVGKELRELFQPQRLGAGAQEEVEEVEIVNALGQLKAELRIGEHGFTGWSAAFDL